MPTKGCHFQDCKQGLLNRDDASLNKKEKRHKERYHTQAAHLLVIRDAVFRFRRDPTEDMFYVCVCGSHLACAESLSTHVLGSLSQVHARQPCPAMDRLSDSIGRSKRPLYEDTNNNLPFNAWPRTDRNQDTPPTQHLSIQQDLKQSEKALANAMLTIEEARSIVLKHLSD
ncbi:MAG: hypothetical protein J3Q66DRAFT_332452 [Benniella sp.]|nr:MAG: hypothetical protein J3Q66DRAFT_332452 [Benniella sp.]